MSVAEIDPPGTRLAAGVHAGAGSLTASIDAAGNVVLTDTLTHRVHTVTNVAEHVATVLALAGAAGDGPDALNVVWTSTAVPGSAPGAAVAAALLRRAVTYLEPAHQKAHARMVPDVCDRLPALLEDAGLAPSTALRVTESLRRELHVLVADVMAAASASLRRRLAVDLAANLVPHLDGKVDR